MSSIESSDSNESEEIIEFNKIAFVMYDCDTIVGNYLTQVKEVRWSSDSINLSQILIKINTIECNLYSVIAYKDIERIDYFIDEQILKLFIKPNLSSADQIREALNLNEHTEDVIRFIYGSQILIERYITVVVNYKTREEIDVFIDWLDKMFYTSNPYLNFNRINFDLSSDVLSKLLIKRLRQEYEVLQKEHNELKEKYVKLLQSSKCRHCNRD